MPSYAYDKDAGIDLHAHLTDPISLHPGQRVLVPTGLFVRIPSGYEGQVRPRSGLALKQGVTVLNSPGTIDAGYTGEIGVILINMGHDVCLITDGDRIAQMVVAPVIHVKWTQWTDDDPQTAPSGRADKGFGSSGQSC